MRENIELFKDSIHLLKEQNEELQNKIANAQDDPKQMITLFTGLKEDNEKLAEQLKKMQEDNCQLSHYLSVSKDTIQQQNGIIKGLQSVIDSLQNS